MTASSGALGLSSSTATGSSSGEEAAAVITRPNVQAFAGQEWAYAPVLNKSGLTVWSLVSGPAGATVSPTGRVQWTPTDNDPGTHAFTIRGTLGAETTDQAFFVMVGSFRTEQSAVVSPFNLDAVVVAVDGPLSPITGAAVTFPPGSLAGLDDVTVTISAVGGLQAPGSLRAAGEETSALRPVEFGPTGTVFNAPVDIQLPIPSSFAAEAELVVQTLDQETGQWSQVPIKNVDRVSGYATAETMHFSTYVVTQKPANLDVTLQLGKAGTSCANSMLIATSLKIPIDTNRVTLSKFGETKTDTIQNLIAGIPNGGGMALVRTSAVKRQGAYPLFPLADNYSGKVYSVFIDRDSAGVLTLDVRNNLTARGATSIYRKSPLSLTADAALVAAFMRGLGNVEIVASPPDGPWMVLTTVDLSLSEGPGVPYWITWEERTDASGTLTNSMLDSDCDRLTDPYDNGVTPATPVLTATPASLTATAKAGTNIRLGVTQDGTSQPVAFSADNSNVTLTVASEGQVDAKGSAAGNYKVTATAGTAPNTSSVTWSLTILPPDPPPNVAPTVKLTGPSGGVVANGKDFTVNAVGTDPDGDSTRLTYAWTMDGVAYPDAAGQKSFTSFTYTDGDHTVACTVSDGQATGTGSIKVNVAANVAPGTPSVTPNNRTLDLTVNPTATLVTVFNAVDPDGTVADYALSALPSTPSYTLTATTLPAGQTGSAYLFTPTGPGTYRVLVRAKDNQAKVGPGVTFTVNVLAIPQPPVDTDGDRHAAGTGVGADCNDADATIHPGAKEICGDGIDQDCSGADKLAVDCDADGDGFPGATDCNDANPSVYNGATELCDGVDNNCDTVTDEGYAVAMSCQASLDMCTVAGTMQCDSTRLATGCVAPEGAMCPLCHLFGDTCDAQFTCCEGLSCNLGICGFPECIAAGQYCNPVFTDQCCMGKTCVQDPVGSGGTCQ